METMAIYVLLGCAAILVLFAILLSIFMVSFDDKTYGTNRRLSRNENLLRKHSEELERRRTELQMINRFADNEKARVDDLEDRVSIIEEHMGLDHRSNPRPTHNRRIA